MRHVFETFGTYICNIHLKRRVVSGSGETGKQAAVARSRWSKLRRCGHGDLVREWMGKQRQFEKKVRAAIFYFYFHADGSVACWAILASRPTNVCLDKTDFLATALSFINIYNYIYIQLLKYKSECIRCRSLSLIPVL